mgnify:CR=1 FL=1
MLNQGAKSDDSVAIGGMSNEDLAQKNHPMFTSYFFTIPKAEKSINRISRHFHSRYGYGTSASSSDFEYQTLLKD